MTKKRRRGESPKRQGARGSASSRPSSGATPPARAASGDRRPRSTTRGGTEAKSTTRGRAEPDEDSTPQAAVPTQPPLLPSLARGLAAVGSSVPTLATAFLGVLVVWLLYSSLRIPGLLPPGTIAQFEAAPPLHSVIDTILYISTSPFLAPATAVGLTLAVAAIRTVLVAFWISMCIETFEGAGGGWAAVRPALSRAARSLQTVLAIEVSFLVLLLGLLFVLGPLLGPLALPIDFIAPVYFLAYVPVVAVREQAGLRESFRLGIRAARVRGPQHSILVFGYVMVTILLFFAARTPAAPATPSPLVWAYALFLNFVHVSVLATFVYRWLSMRDGVLVWTPPKRSRTASAARSRRRPAGLR